MAAFRFEAASATGRVESGLLEADSARAARSILRERGLAPLVVEAVAVAVDQATTSRWAGRLSQADLALVTRQLAGLLSARLPLEQALNAVIEQAENQRVRDRFAAVRSEVVAGHGIASALGRFPRDFPEVYRALVAAGEQSGDLAVVMTRLADWVESRSALASRVTMAFLYPGIVTAVALLVIVGLLTYVVPQVVGVFAQTRQKLPLLTVMLIATSDFLRAWWWLLAVALGAAAVAGRAMLAQPAVRMIWDARLLELPIVGRLVRGLDTARFASTIAILAAGGVPLLRALEAGAQTLGNRALRVNVDDAISRVREGATLSRSLAVQGRFPPMLVHLIASGEATGELPAMLERAAALQAQEVERRTMTLTGLLEPLLILAVGGIVLVIVLAVLMPIIEINQLVR
jgi:general secretion pathway protein F